jgi:magnesium chelatase subunit D
MPDLYPFCAIVSQDRMRQVLILSAAGPRIGGVLIRSEGGTAKSIAALLPELQAVAGCCFGCDPAFPKIRKQRA